MLLVQQFIKENPTDWIKRLKDDHGILVKEDGDYYLLKYDFIGADMKKAMTRECRGIILDKDFNVVNVPFWKFGNLHEEVGYRQYYADELRFGRSVEGLAIIPEIDWNSARVLEKVDGSLMSLWYDRGAWHVSSSGTIDAMKAVCIATGISYGAKFEEARLAQGLNYDNLDKDYTYVFELVSPETRVVIPYDKTAIYHLTTRNKKTLEEVEMNIGIQKPKLYSFKSLADVVSASTLLPWNDEGYVVVDKYYNRVKIKSITYVKVHHMGSSSFLDKNGELMSIICSGEVEEVCGYFPEAKPRFEEVEIIVDKARSHVKEAIQYYKDMKFTRREAAQWINQNVGPLKGYVMNVMGIEFANVEKGLDRVPKTFDEYIIGLVPKQVAELYPKMKEYYENK